MIGTGKGRSAGGPPLAACRSSGPQSARCDRPTSSWNLEEDSADSEVDWEAVSGWDSRSESRAEEDSCGRSSASTRRDPPEAAPEGAPPTEDPSRVAFKLLHFADRLLSKFYLCAVWRFRFYATGQLCQQTAEKELYGYTAKSCPQIAHRKRYGRALNLAKRRLPKKDSYDRFRWGWLVKYKRRLGIVTCEDARSADESGAAAEA